jgi:hypothetical protein
MKTLAFLFALIIPASARIGETVEECRDRYGDPVHIDQKAGSMGFLKSGFLIACQFHKGRVGMIIVIKNQKPGEITIGHAELSEVEIETLLKANAGGGEWADTTPQFEFVSKLWGNEKAKRKAFYNTIQHTLVFITDEYSDVMAKEKADTEQKKLGDF